MNDAGIYRKHYPASQQIAASPSVLTWRIVVRVVQSLAATLTSLDVSRNTGVDLEVSTATASKCCGSSRSHVYRYAFPRSNTNFWSTPGTK